MDRAYVQVSPFQLQGSMDEIRLVHVYLDTKGSNNIKYMANIERRTRDSVNSTSLYSLYLRYSKSISLLKHCDEGQSSTKRINLRPGSLLSYPPPVANCRPSVSVTRQSMRNAFRPRACGLAETLSAFAIHLMNTLHFMSCCIALYVLRQV